MLEAVATARRRADDLRVRRPGAVGLALLRELRPAGRRRAGRRLRGLRASAPGRRDLLRHCGRPVETSDEAEPEAAAPQPAEEPAVDETILHSADPWER